MNEQNVPNANDAKLATSSELDAAQVAEIGGGGAENCAVTVQISGDGITGTFSAGSVGEALIAAYEGMVDATSHVIGRVLGP
ncbi:MAG: hypothetical protein IPJ28_04725 [Betaproteobacteria bacterium]|nr:hypothetical protein [Betaproteobacteria bacterium]